MFKLLAILVFGLACESIGVVLLKKGMNSIGDMAGITVPEVLRVFGAGITNPQILLGIFFEAVFFGCLLILMSKSDISFLWPLTGLSFVFATFAATYFLGEQVSAVRWSGVVFIMIGAGLISYSEHQKTRQTQAVAVKEISHPQ